MIITFHWAVGKQLVGQVSGTCPHCRTTQRFDRFNLNSYIWFLPLPKSEILLCRKCGAYSRRESQFKRTLGAIFLIPFILALAMGFLTGLYFIFNMIVGTTPWSPGLCAVGLILLSVSGYICYRTIRFTTHLLMDDSLIPMKAQLTQI